MGQLAAFLGVSAIVIMLPGPDTALTIRNALLGGRRSGAFTALGVATGLATWALATGAGLAALLRDSGPVFEAVKLAGAAYLIFLGAQALRAALRRDLVAQSHKVRGPRLRAGRSREFVAQSHKVSRTAFRQGLISNLGNPKIAVFFTSLLPQFAGGTSFPALAGLGLVFALMTLLWLTAYGVAAAKAGDVLRRPRVRRALEGVTGAVLVALGLRLAAERA